MAPSSSIVEFRKVFQHSNYVVALTGAGISADSGIPTFRGSDSYWRGHQIQDVARYDLFQKNPSLVWELYHYRRKVAKNAEPNTAHKVLAECQQRFERDGKKFVIITQNIDELHSKAAVATRSDSKLPADHGIIELHGSLYKVQCINCKEITRNYASPICPALLGKGSPEGSDANIPRKYLPRCRRASCGGILRPYIIWFDEDPTDAHMTTCNEWLANCDLCLVIGTSSLVEPANEFGPAVVARGVPVAEFNLERTPATDIYQFHIEGSCSSTLADALAPF